MESLADEYVEAMRGVQPEGPYYFGGMCDGAHLGIRMARKLEQLGESVGMLAIFDTWVLENSQRRWAWNIYYYSQRLREFPKLSFHEQLNNASRSVARLAKRILGRPEPQGLWPQAYWPGEDYVPPTFRGRVTLFKRPKQPYFYVRDPQMGWGSRAQGGVDVQVLPIHHGEMLHEPSVQILAQRLTLCLRQAHPEMSFPSRESRPNGKEVVVGAKLQSEGQQ
jgi:thioesterase domain-containing protein